MRYKLNTEVEKFSKMANEWWDLDGPCKALHRLNPTRTSFITNKVDLNSLECLDIGCGGGILSESLAREGAKVIGIDASAELIEVAKLHAKNQNLDINYQSCFLEDYIQKENKKFDIITCMELLEHLDKPQEFLKYCASILKPGGKLFLSTLNRTPKAFITAIIGAEYVMRLLPRGTHEYNKFIKPSELHSWLRMASLNLEEVQGVFYNPITHNTSFSDDLDVNYMVYAQNGNII